MTNEEAATTCNEIFFHYCERIHLGPWFLLPAAIAQAEYFTASTETYLKEWEIFSTRPTSWEAPYPHRTIKRVLGDKD